MGAKLKVEANTSLERAVKAEINRHASDYESGAAGFLKDLFYGGCESGMVGSLIYYKDTCRFYARHKAEIAKMLAEMLEDVGCDGPSGLFGDKWDKEDPLASDDLNQNLLAWFAFEETARRLADRAGIES